MLRAGQVVTRAELHDKVWDMHFDPSSNLVDAHVARLRKKISSASSVSLTTRRGMGFVLAAVEPDAQDEYGRKRAQA
jgi:DNA-binding response OmpR family regulator